MEYCCVKNGTMGFTSISNQIFGDAKKSTFVPIGGDVEMKEESKSSESGFKVDP